jgi:hypothetical protein
MNTNMQNNEDQEIDLSVLTKKIRGFYESFLSWIFGWVLFAKRNAKYIIGLFVIGCCLGFYLDITNNSYKNEIIVSPNFGSVNYMYSKIDLLTSKINQGDTVFLKNIGIKNPDKIGMVKIEPIVDIYSLVNNNTAIAGNAENTQNFELLKLLAEDGDLKKVITEDLTNKQYARHLITINSNGTIEYKNEIEPILKFLNQNEYYEKLRKTEVENIYIKMKKNEELAIELNGLIEKLTLALSNNTKSNSLVYYNENTPLTGLIERKVSLVNELAGQKMQLIGLDAFIKKSSAILNIKNTKGLNGKMKIVLPIFFIFMFFGINIFVNFYKKQQEKILAKQS